MIEYVTEEDLSYLKKDPHISFEMLEKKITDREMMVCKDGEAYIGWLRFNYFWDAIPFLNLIFIEEGYRRQGHGKAMLHFWESEMSKEGHKSVLTSSMSNEQGQHFFRKQGYVDSGSLLLPEEPLEVIFLKEIKINPATSSRG